MFSKTVRKQIPLLILFILAIYMIKPSLIFKPNGKPREYGFGYDNEGYKKTLFTFLFVVMIASILIMIQAH